MGTVNGRKEITKRNGILHLFYRKKRKLNIFDRPASGMAIIKLLKSVN